ncbi:hypothetical protein C8R42DRAFT_728892 [Lentinula raphanica]|nr:hypothetical protein C8R42DRAFT_728892 [Lentinula raphanica]
MHSLESVHALDTLLNSLHTQKANLLHQLEQIDADIAAAGRKRAKICNDAALVSKLPPELLSHIFLLCQKDKPAFRLIATRVCSRWRELAVGTQKLWTDIRISIANQSHIQPGLDKMETYLSHSAPSSLFAVRLNVDEDLDFAPFLKLIASQISRCARLLVCVQEHKQACLLLREHLGSLRAPHLDYLALNIDWTDSETDRTICGTPSIFKAGAPSLNHLQLSRFASGLRPPKSSCITTLYLHGRYMQKLTVLEYRGMLAAHRCLVNLSLQWLKLDYSMPTESEGALELPKLRSLRIRTNRDDPASAEALLNALPLSALESLVLSDIDDLYSYGFPSVKDLSLHYCDCYPEIEPEIVSDQLILPFPSVIRLTLEPGYGMAYTTPSIHDELMMSPKLRTLCIRDVKNMADVHALSRLVQDRSRANCPLEYVYLDSSSYCRTVNIIPALETPTTLGHISDDPDPWPPGANIDR